MADRAGVSCLSIWMPRRVALVGDDLPVLHHRFLRRRQRRQRSQAIHLSAPRILVGEESLMEKEVDGKLCNVSLASPDAATMLR
jgi:hypothetical protein